MSTFNILSLSMSLLMSMTVSMSCVCVYLHVPSHPAPFSFSRSVHFQCQCWRHQVITVCQCHCILFTVRISSCPYRLIPCIICIYVTEVPFMHLTVCCRFIICRVMQVILNTGLCTIYRCHFPCSSPCPPFPIKKNDQ